jgi:hypothetical protein
MTTTNKLLVTGIVFGLGFGTGLRATRKPVEPSKAPTLSQYQMLEKIDSTHRNVSQAMALQESVANTRPTNPLDQVLDAIAQVESNGNPRAIGDSGRAVGLFQIWEIYVREANRIQGRNKFTPKDRLDPNKSREMTRIVLEYWSKYHQSHGRHMGPAEICSIHRHPNAKWRPSFMNTKHEQNRTKKLLTYLER